MLSNLTCGNGRYRRTEPSDNKNPISCLLMGFGNITSIYLKAMESTMALQIAAVMRSLAKNITLRVQKGLGSITFPRNFAVPRFVLYPQIAYSFLS